MQWFSLKTSIFGLNQNMFQVTGRCHSFTDVRQQTVHAWPKRLCDFAIKTYSGTSCNTWFRNTHSGVQSWPSWWFMTDTSSTRPNHSCVQSENMYNVLSSDQSYFQFSFLRWFESQWKSTNYKNYWYPWLVNVIKVLLVFNSPSSVSKPIHGLNNPLSTLDVVSIICSHQKSLKIMIMIISSINP